MVTRLDIERAEADKRIEELQAQLAQTQQDRDWYLSGREEAKQALAQAQREMDTLQQEVERLKADNQQYHTENNELRSDVERRRQLGYQLEDQIMSYQADPQYDEQRRIGQEQMRTEVDMLQQQVATLKTLLLLWRAHGSVNDAIGLLKVHLTPQQVYRMTDEVLGLKPQQEQ